MNTIEVCIICLLFSVLASCSPKETEDPVPEVIITSDFYFEGIIDDKRVLMQDGENHFLVDAGSGCSMVFDCGCCKPLQRTGLSTGDKFEESNGMVKLEFLHIWFNETFTYEPEGSELDTMFRKEKYAFRESDGVVVRYLDPNGKLWGSDGGDNEDAFLEIVKISDDVTNDENSVVQLHKIIEFQFTCTLYPFTIDRGDPNQKDKIKLENGRMRIRAGRY